MYEGEEWVYPPGPSDSSATDAEFLTQNGIPEGTPVIWHLIPRARVKRAEIAVQLIGPVRRK